MDDEEAFTTFFVLYLFPNFVPILSRLRPDFVQISSQSRPDFVPILSRFHPDFVLNIYENKSCSKIEKIL